MLGKNHIVVNICSVVILHESLYQLSKFKYTPQILTTYIEQFLSLITQQHRPFWWAYVTGWVVLFIIGSCLPDTDSMNSLLGRYVYIRVEHRTWTHTAWFLMPFGLFVVYDWLYLGLFLGIFLHLFWDDLSKMGICWFYPISNYRKYASGAKVKKKHHFWLYRTGGISEYVVVTVVFCIAVFLLHLRFRYMFN